MRFGVASMDNSVRRANLAGCVFVNIVAGRAGNTAEKERIHEILRDFRRFRENL